MIKFLILIVLIGITAAAIPKKAIKLADNLYKHEINPNVHALYIIHKKHTKRPETRARLSSSNFCCSYIQRIPKLYTKQFFQVSFENLNGLSQYDIKLALNQSITKWNNVFATSPYHTQYTTISSFPGFVYNGKNQIGFGLIGDTSALAVTAIWITCHTGGSLNSCSNLEISEWDQMYNTLLYNFGDVSEENTIYDIYTTVLHEFGHPLGLGDLCLSFSANQCSSHIMWGITGIGDSLRSIDTTTIQCINSLGYIISSSYNLNANPGISLARKNLFF